jgi:TonB family protein
MICFLRNASLSACFILLTLNAAFSSTVMPRDTTVQAAADSIFTTVDEPASFPGGVDALVQFLVKTVRYPSSARKNGEQGAVFISMLVDKSGALSEFEVVKGVSEALDKEALRVANLFPAWTPAKNNGQVVRSRYVLPFKFKLADQPEGGPVPKKLRRRDWH